MKSKQQPYPASAGGSFDRRLLAWLCAAILVVSTLPLYVISLYNHPYYDDYRFSAGVRNAWRETGSPGQVLAAVAEGARDVRATWQGTYTGTIFSHVQPGVFSERLYFISTFFLLSVFLLCFGFFLKAVFRDHLGLPWAESIIFISLVLTLLVQFMPDPDEAFFWFNGGIGNTFIYSLLALSLGLCVRLERCHSTAKSALLLAVLAVIMVLLGGGSYGGGIFGLLVYGLLTAGAFWRKNPRRFAYLGLTALFLAGFLYSVTAPGNEVRAGIIAYAASPAKAVAQALYYGVAVGAGYLRLPLLAVTALVIPFFAKAAQKTLYSFGHPWLVLLAGLCLYTTQFAPPLYSGVFIGGGRIVDTYYQSFVVLWFLYAFYVTGFFVRRAEASGQMALCGEPSPRAWRGLVLACCCLLLVGCLAYKRPQDALYGPQNMAGPSAALSLIKGEARQYDREMKSREALLNDPSQPHITLSPLSVVPEIFMKDLLIPGARDDVKPMLCAYYGKESIVLEGEH